MSSQTSELVFVPLGGHGQIGMNASVLGCGRGDSTRWIMIDCGVAFPDETKPGVGSILPDIRFIEERRDDLLAIIVTHAHLDHIGGLRHLWRRLRAPVYATPLAAAMLRDNRIDGVESGELELREVRPGETIELGPFRCELAPVAHSIPESNALLIETPLGVVVHSGDWRIDPDPVLGAQTSAERFKAIGDKGVLAFICDSTNVLSQAREPSERKVADALDTLIADAKGRVVVTTFASNLARVRAAMDAGRRHGREIALIGSGMTRNVAIARDLGLFDGAPQTRAEDDWRALDPAKTLLVVTGSQGESNAALARFADASEPDFALDKGDRVIFSSRPIPGNEKAVTRIVDALVRQGVEVVTHRDALTHASGHPSRSELEAMYGWLRPRIAIPAHGEALHLQRHAEAARSFGTKHALRVLNGQMARLAPGEPAIVDHLDWEQAILDGSVILEPGDCAVAERAALSQAGAISVAMRLRPSREIEEMYVSLRGLPRVDGNGEPFRLIVRRAAAQAASRLDAEDAARPGDAAKRIEAAIVSEVRRAWGKEPMCWVALMDADAATDES